VPSRRSIVALVACPDYDRERVSFAVRKGLDLLEYAGPGAGSEALLLKPNMLRGALPQKGVTTHPAVFAGVARALMDRGARLSFGDSPNGIFRQSAVAAQTGLAAEAESLGIPMEDFDDGEEVAYPAGVQNRRFLVARSVLAAGVIVNLPRLKTHSLTVVTGALKNTFGVVPGSRKAEFHIKHPDVEGFSRMIVDLNGLVRSHLVIMDAIRVMEGNGPSSGTLADVGLLVLSEDPVAADAVGCRIMGIDPLTLPMLRMAEEAGLGNADADHIEIRGEAIEAFARKDLDIPFRSVTERIPRFIMRFAKDLAIPKPVIDPQLCIRCGECVMACPTSPKALAQDKGGVPRYNYAICIRCYCCQETCPQGAISVKRAPLGRFFGTG
jgi:uncharacterized protein (DUF362 family)/Pyruvate/2-oxoacid:ferredoxin oxidoreductase delta subunit